MNAKQARFVEEYIVDLNATQAAIRSGYSERSAYSTGERMLRNAEVQAAVTAAQQARSARTQITADRVLQEFGRIAFSDVRKLVTETDALRPLASLDDDTARAVSSVEVVTRPGAETDADGNRTVEYVHKLKLWDKKGALDSIAKHLGMMVERIAGADGGPVTFRWLDD